MLKFLRSFCVSMVFPCLFIWMWQIVASRMDNEIILPQVGQVLELLLNPFRDVICMGSLVSNIWISMLRVFCGYLAAVLLAIPLGIIMGYSVRTDQLLTGFLGLFLRQPHPLQTAFASGGKTVAALSGLNLAVFEKSFLCVVGPSGCGKSTLLRIMAGLESCTRGSVLFHGMEQERPRSEIGMIFQEYSLFP